MSVDLGFTLHAYVLMINHVHLLLEIGDQPLSRTMQTIQFTYNQYYNRRYEKSGHVFQGRYQAILCDRESYLLELVRYLHLNPARIRKPVSPWTYRWSSHAAYVGRSSSVQVSTEPVLGSFHRQIGPARQAYRRYMREGLAHGHQDRFYETVDQRFLGDERFIEEADRRTSAMREVTARPQRVDFRTLLVAVATAYAVTPREIVSPGQQRTLVPARAMLVYLAREWSHQNTRDLGRRLQRDPSMVSRLAAAYAAHRNPTMEAHIRQAIIARIPTGRSSAFSLRIAPVAHALRISRTIPDRQTLSDLPRECCHNVESKRLVQLISDCRPCRSPKI